jgi:hypothetical protein
VPPRARRDAPSAHTHTHTTRAPALAHIVANPHKYAGLNGLECRDCPNALSCYLLPLSASFAPRILLAKPPLSIGPPGLAFLSAPPLPPRGYVLYMLASMASISACVFAPGKGAAGGRVGGGGGWISVGRMERGAELGRVQAPVAAVGCR